MSIISVIDATQAIAPENPRKRRRLALFSGARGDWIEAGFIINEILEPVQPQTISAASQTSTVRELANERAHQIWYVSRALAKRTTKTFR